MIKVYFETIEKFDYLPLVYSYNEKEVAEPNPYIRSALSEIQSHFVERVDDPAAADYLIIPHYFKYVRKNEAYITRLRALAKEHNKKILIFVFEDHYSEIDWPEAVIFRTSAYNSEMKDNEFILPYIVEDLLKNREMVLRDKPEKPVVSFAGWAKFDTFTQELRSRTKDVQQMLSLLIRGVFDIGVRRKGLFVRVELVKRLQADSRVATNFIVRSNYGGSGRTKTEEEMKAAREEFIMNMVESDTILSPRGDGNGSQRFYESLSLARFPLLIDTDMRLPFNDTIPYERFVIRVPYKDRKNTAQYVEDFFSALSDEEYKKRQQEAYTYFKQYLSLNGFYKHLFVDEHIRDTLK